MQAYNVFCEGVSWRYSVDGVLSPEKFESRDDAAFAAEQAVINKRKEHEAAHRAAKAAARKLPSEVSPES